MKKLIPLLLTLALFGCTAAPAPTTAETTVTPTTIPETTVPETTVPETTVPVTTAPLHSELFLEHYTVEDVITAFNEVVLQMEYTDGTGDPSRVQKWLTPLQCIVFGAPTAEDLEVLEAFFAELNQIPGFPGISITQEDTEATVTLGFLSAENFRNGFSEVVNGEDAWGACQFWYYTDTCELYDARIGYRTDIPQLDRNSILLEEVVNILGISDTEYRTDSIVYQYSNDNLHLSDMDLLILNLLYHPDMESGMDREQCEAVIRNLYY